ncbi:malate synthase [Oligoflexus tunisiensis]|uniref:malate synthase n=1 Tax=Oligoflexus tunisiensis TaxID=708132 RepID=UPI000A67749F|nr:malate synthase [Oligoflexus tunisiensis]
MSHGKPAASLIIRSKLDQEYHFIISPEALGAIQSLYPLDVGRKLLMEQRLERRRERFTQRKSLGFLDPNDVIEGTKIKVQDARVGKFVGSAIPHDLKRQWIQGTGPATKPHADLQSSLRNVAYALLSGADGWMFDGEDALGQIETMSLDNQRNLKLAIAKDPLFMKVAADVAQEMNRWAQGFFARDIIQDWQTQLDYTTRIFRPRGLHLDDRHFTWGDGSEVGASLVDLCLYVVNNYANLQQQNRSIVLYLPKIQRAAEAAYWNKILNALEDHLKLKRGALKVYVLVEQLEAAFQLMEIRAALGPHFVGFNTGRWDYINSVADAMAWDQNFVNPNIEAITMTYSYMREYEDRVRRCVNTPDIEGHCALWQGGMEPNIPVGTESAVKNAMVRAVAGAQREHDAGASGKWVAHWKMVHIAREVWQKVGKDNQLGRSFPRLGYGAEDAARLTALEPAPRTVNGARGLLSIALQYGNAFLTGHQAAALKAADYFGDASVLYLMEDMATGEIRASILWEWLHKGARLTEDDKRSGARKGDTFSQELWKKLLTEEYDKLLKANPKDVHEDSKTKTLPIVREIMQALVLSPIKAPWYVDLLNLNIGNHDLEEAKKRIQLYFNELDQSNTRITRNVDFHKV